MYALNTGGVYQQHQAAASEAAAGLRCAMHNIAMLQFVTLRIGTGKTTPETACLAAATVVAQQQQQLPISVPTAVYYVVLVRTQFV